MNSGEYLALQSIFLLLYLYFPHALVDFRQRFMHHSVHHLGVTFELLGFVDRYESAAFHVDYPNQLAGSGLGGISLPQDHLLPAVVLHPLIIFRIHNRN